MNEPWYTVVCDRCGERLDDLPVSPDEFPPCPQCGSRDQKRVFADGGVLLTAPPISAPPIQEWFEMNWLSLLGGTVLTVAGFLVGGWIGLLVGAAASVVGVGAFTKVRGRKTERF